MNLKRWVLIVDDDPMMLQMMSDFVRGPEIRATTASDALQAFIQARDLQPVLIISDMQMPKFYGVAALTELRKSPKTADIPFIFVTGMEPSEAEKLIPVGTPKVRLLSKPVDWAKLEAFIKDLTGLVIGPDGSPEAK